MGGKCEKTEDGLTERERCVCTFWVEQTVLAIIMLYNYVYVKKKKTLLQVSMLTIHDMR